MLPQELVAVIAFVSVLLNFIQLLASAKKDQKIQVLDLSLQSCEGDLKRAQAAAGAKSPSLELTEFLRDQSQHGYSFVRVDPVSVMIRSPREFS